MPVPSPRSKLLPARGNYSDLAANVAELLDGEICYAIDQDQYYQKEGSVLVSVGATKAQGLLADSALQDAPSDGSEYVRRNGSWVVSTGGGGGATTIDGLTDVDTSSVAPTDGQALIWSAADSEWQPGTVSGGGGGASSLDDLSDVDLTAPPSNGQVLVYDSAESAFKPSTVAVDGAGQPVITYVINASGTSAYTFTGPGFTAPTGNPELYVVRGQTYVFGNQSGAHPFQIQSTQGSGGTAYNDGVTGNNTIGDVILTVPYDAPDTLYYQCTAHAAMNGTINVSTVSAGGGGGATSLDELSDVDTTSNTPLDGQLLSYNDSTSVWEPTDPGSGTAGPTPQAPNAAQNFEAYSTGDFDDWADGLSSTGSRIGSAHCDYSAAAGSGCTDSWSVDTDAMWMEFWFKHDETAPGDQIIWGVASPNAPSPQVGDSGFHCKLMFDTFELAKETPHATALVVMKGTSNANDSILQTINTNPADGQWHHYAIYLQPQSEANGGSYFNNDGLFTLYVDGRVEDTYDNGGEFDMRPVGPYSSDTLTLMANTDGTKPCRGQMDNFRAFTANSLPVPRQVEAFTPNEDDAGTPIAYALPKQIDSTLNLTDFSQAPAAEGQSPVYRNGKYTPVNHLNVVKFIIDFNDTFPLPVSADDDLSTFLGFSQEPGMCIVDTVGGSLWIWTGPYDPIDSVGGWVTCDLFSGGGAPA